MSGYYGTPLGTEDRERKIFELKKKIVKMYGSSLINFLSYQKSVPVIYRDDSPEVKKAKQDEIELIIQEREEEYREREDELLDELNKLIGRIRNKNDSLEPNSEFYSLTFTQADEGKRISCPKCGNKDLNNTILDTIRGDITCNGKDNQGCGEVLEENTIYSGAEKRNFEGEDERNHHGPSPNKLMPDVVNLETSIYIGINGKESSEFKRLSYASQRMEMDLSKIDKDEKHTRQGYKTKMKRRAFKLIEEIGDNLNIHKTVLAQAEIEFAKYRDMKEAVHKFEGTVAACIVIAYEDLSKTMQLDEARKSYNIVSDIARFETTYGNLPSYEEVKDDVAISTVPNLNMGKFTIDQAKVWIEAISQHGNQQKISKHKPTIAQIYIDFQFYGNLLYQYIQEEYEQEKEKFNQKNKVASEARSRASSVMSNESSSNPSTTTAMDVTASTPTPAAASGALSLLEKRKKEKADTLKTLFGNTTISHRLQQLQKKTTNNNLTNAPSLAVISGAHTATGNNEGNSLSNLEKFPGKLLLKIFPKEIIKQKLLAPRTPTPTTTATYQTLPTSTSTAGVLYDENDVQIVHDYFRQAIQRRSSFDKLVVEKLHEQELEMKRIRVEESLAITHRKRIIEEYKQEHGNSNEVKMEVDGEGNQKKKRKISENEGKISENDEVKIEFVDDIDLEELIGGPVMKVQTTVSKPLSSSSSSGPKGILKKVATASSTSSTNTQIPHVKAEPSTTISVKEEKLHTSPVKIKAEPISSSPASISSSVPSSQPAPVKAPATSTVPAPKKVGMKPRPKIVIS